MPKYHLLNPCPALQDVLSYSRLLVNKIPAHKKKGMRHVFAMLLCFSTLLLLLYYESRASIYSDAYDSILKAVKYEEAQGIAEIGDTDLIWPWLREVFDKLGGDTLSFIESNCGPNPEYANAQTVEIDGKQYQLLDPEFQKTSCQNNQYIPHANEVYLTGNFEVIVLGLFTSRAHLEFPNSHAVSPSQRYNILLSENPQQLSPFTDTNIVQVCDVPWPEIQTSTELELSISNKCIFRDGFMNSSGSTMGWSGKEIENFYAFDRNSFSITKLESSSEASSNFSYLYPCFGYSVDPVTSEEVLLYGNPSFQSPAPSDSLLNNCEYIWLTPGSTIRSFCLEKEGSQPTALESFDAGYEGYDSSDEVLDSDFSCSTVTNFDPETLKNVYLESQFNLRDKYDEYFYGSFVPVTDESDFLRTSNRVMSSLVAHRYLSKRTRTFRTVLMLRNSERNSLYYSMVICDFNINSNGNVEASFSVTHVPITQFVYGLGDYNWYFREIVAIESVMLLVFALFFLREFYQVIVRLIKFFKNKKIYIYEVQELPSAKVENKEISNINNNNTSDSMVSEIEDMDVELGGNNCIEIVNKEKEKDKTSNTIIKNKFNFKDDSFKISNQMSMSEYLPDKGSFMNDLKDWVTIAAALLAVIYRVVYVKQCELLHRNIIKFETADTLDERLKEIITEFSSLHDMQEDMNSIALFLCWIGLLQFFRYLEFDERLGIVTKTMSKAFFDLLPVFVIFCIVMVVYGVLGTTLYGHELQAFSTLSESLTTLFLIVLGNSMYVELFSISSVQTIFYYWSFIALVGFLLLNMVLAVIFKVYEDTYSDISAGIRDGKQD